MNRILKKITSTVIAAAVALTAFVFGAPVKTAEAAFSTSATGGCDGNHDGMTVWSYAGGKISESGNYYLDSDFTLTGKVSIEGNVTLCLNGYKITAPSDDRIFQINEVGSLTLCDCNGSGNNDGILTGGKASVFGGGAVRVNGGSFTMYGGTISGNNVPKYDGGGVSVDNNGIFIMNGGKISDNIATDAGGVYIDSGKFIMNGGEISHNETIKDYSDRGGGVWLKSGNFTMNSGKISDNTSVLGGGVCVTGGVYEMKDGEISSNSTFTDQFGYGGGVAVGEYGTFNMKGGTISDNDADNDGGGVWLYDNNPTFTMSGGAISSNNTRYNGGGVYVGSGTFTINGQVNISNNTKINSVTNNVYLGVNKTITIGENFEKAT